MANTLKFGNGEWATKEGSALAYNDENGNFKPLPFTFDRSTSATRVNKEGLIELVSNNEPRIDFSNDAKGALLLEPTRSNELTYSNSSNFSLTRCTRGVQSNKLGIVNGYEYSNATSNPNININYSETTLGYKTFSLFIDATNSDYFNIRLATGGGADFGAEVTFTPSTKSFSSISENSTYVRNSSVGYEYFGDNIYRIWITTEYILYLGSTFPIVYFGDNTNVWMGGIQIEQGSYATSYIPTAGSQVTKVADTMPTFLDLNSLNIGNSYTLFLDADLNVNDNNKVFSVINNSSDVVSFSIRNNVGGIRVYNHIDASYPVSGIISANNKFVIRVDGNSYKIFVQGSSLSGTLTTQRDLGSLNFTGSNTELKINNFTIDNTALSDAECEALTSN